MGVWIVQATGLNPQRLIPSLSPSICQFAQCYSAEVGACWQQWEKKAFGSGPNGRRHAQIDEWNSRQFIGWENLKHNSLSVYVDRSKYWNVGQPIPEPNAQRGTARHGRRVGNLQPIEPRRPPKHLGQTHIIFVIVSNHQQYFDHPSSTPSLSSILSLSLSLSPSHHQVAYNYPKYMHTWNYLNRSILD